MNKEEFRRKVFSLSEQLYPMVARLLGKHANVEDALQEIMLKLWVKRDTIEQHPNPKALVFLIARNYCFDVLRKKRPELADSTGQLTLLKSENGQEPLE